MTAIENHLKHGYYVSIFKVTDKDYVLSLPENKLANIAKQEIHFRLDDGKMEFNGKLDIDRNGQAAFLALYIAVEQRKRSMRPELIAVFDEENKNVGNGFYSIANFTEEERELNGGLLNSLLKGSEPDPKVTNNHKILKKMFIGD